MLDTLAADSGPTAEEAEGRFAPTFLAELPSDQISAVFDSLRPAGPFTLTGWNDNGQQGSAELDSATMPLMMQISVADGLIDGLYFIPNEEPTATTAAEASQELADAAPASSFYLAEVTGTDGALECSPIEARASEQVLPIGSMFKMYVLGAVVDAVAAGELTWEEELTLTEEVKSLPSGTLQNEPAGTTITIEDAALKMISESDNTATDLLIHAVGREQVEAQLGEMGHHSPELNIPFLTTREAFQLMNDEDLRAQWAEASNGYDDASADVSAAQRNLLDTLPAWDLTFDAEVIATPAWDEGVDWFANAEDLCAAHLHLQEVAATEAGSPVRTIMGANPGIALPDADYIGFKGGSAAGEIGLSFYVEGSSATRVLVMQTAGETAAEVPQPAWLAALAEAALSDA